MRARVISAVLMVLALATSALAEDRQARGVPSLDRVLPEIRRTTPGRFYDAEGPFLAPDGRVTYRIKWMTPDGRIIWFDADARTGRITNSGGRPPSTHNRDEGNPPSDRQRNGGWDYGDRRDHWRDNNTGDNNHDNYRDGDDRNRDWQRDDRGGNWNRGGRDNDGWGNNGGRGDSGRGNRGGRRGRPGG